MENDAVRRDVTLPLSPDEVWPVVTDPEHLEQWLAPEVELDLREGGPAVFRWPDGAERRGVVETVDEPSRFTFRWRSGATRDGHDGAGEVADVVTRVEICLDEVPGGTRLTVVESGFSTLSVQAAAGCTAVARWAWDARLARVPARGLVLLA
jgi:uncharacterized protein YndB with AHSA1/START domain